MPRRILNDVNQLFPGSIHVAFVSMLTAKDGEIWEFARSNGFAIVSKDADFHQRSLVLGHPPKVLWLRLGNSSTSDMLACLRSNAKAILISTKTKKLLSW